MSASLPTGMLQPVNKLKAHEMLINHLNLNDVKCFGEDTEIDLVGDRETPHKWVVIYGGNGLGKSTLLRAFGIALTGQPALNSLFPSAEGWVRSRAQSASIYVNIAKGAGDKSTGSRTRGITLAVKLAGNRMVEDFAGMHPAHSVYPIENFQDVLVEYGKKTAAKRLDADVKLFKEHISSDEPKRGWLICGYGPHRRLTGASSELSERIPPDGRAARLVTLFHEGAALTSSERWLLKLDHQASRKKEAKSRLEAIVEIINTSLVHGNIKLLEITPDGVFFGTPFGAGVPLGDLSDGYRSVLALALDLLRHVDHAFDIESVIEYKDGKAVVTAEGVVLIDEIDAHLHPAWQRTIGAWLHERFPNIQFIVTTHSPLIATRVSETEGLVIRLVRRRKGKSRNEIVGVLSEEGTIGLTADQNLTSPKFSLSSTRDVLADEMSSEIERLRKLVGEGRAGAIDLRKLRTLEANYERVAPATPSFEGVNGWREEDSKIRLATENAADREEKSR